ncbi:MAG: hypothetical protein V3R87_09635, partial [Dehalococcoidia bacterium]
LADGPSGWDADAAGGATFTVRDLSWSQADRDYTNQATDEHVNVLIYDSAYNQSFSWFGAWQTAFEWETTEGYVRKTTVGGYPAFKSFSDPDSYAMMVFVAERFLVIVSSEREASLDQFTNRLDYGGIAFVQ